MTAYQRSRRARRSANLGPTGTSRGDYARRLARAKSLGFSDSQAPFIATASLIRPGWTVRSLRELVQRMHPFLFEDKAQGVLFGEEIL